MNADLILSQAYDKWIRSKNTQSTSKAGVRSRATATKASHKRKYTKAKPKEKVADEEAGYHYVAYIPIDGAVWRLDGLQKQPVKIGLLLPTTLCSRRANMSKVLPVMTGYTWLMITSSSESISTKRKVSISPSCPCADLLSELSIILLCITSKQSK